MYPIVIPVHAAWLAARADPVELRTPGGVVRVIITGNKQTNSPQTNSPQQKGQRMRPRRGAARILAADKELCRGLCHLAEQLGHAQAKDVALHRQELEIKLPANLQTPFLGVG